MPIIATKYKTRIARSIAPRRIVDLSISHDHPSGIQKRLLTAFEIRLVD
jgi:hypothetical protein